MLYMYIYIYIYIYNIYIYTSHVIFIYYFILTLNWSMMRKLYKSSDNPTTKSYGFSWVFISFNRYQIIKSQWSIRIACHLDVVSRYSIWDMKLFIERQRNSYSFNLYGNCKTAWVNNWFSFESGRFIAWYNEETISYMIVMLT